ncbi:MAG: hypothetical protein RL693_2577 [Verrucomicrobiota bacterium]|jgi:hypothetical protein
MKLPARIALACSVTLMLALGMVIFLQHPPERFRFYPQCQLHQLTGLLCPGCGSTRCLHAMIQGRFAEAAQKNIIAFALLPLLGCYGILRAFYWVFGRPFPWRYQITPRFGVWAVFILIAFGILRNLPWYPWTLLAPH